MKITNQEAKRILATYIRSLTWLKTWQVKYQPMLDFSIATKTYRFLATLNQQSETTWLALSQQEQNSVLCEIASLFSQLSNEFYHQNHWIIDEKANEQDQAIMLLQQIFSVPA